MGNLFVVATPIGNLGDLSRRAEEVLRSVSYILCEDTRQSRKLLNAYAIENKLVSFHLFSEKKKEDGVIADLLGDQEVALISDSGTPLICDPGQRLVERCLREKISVVSVPGPCAVIAALSISGFEASRFQFLGFLPKRPGRHKKALQECLDYEGTSICYEAPPRLSKTLQVLASLDPHRELCVARELTKRYEEVVRGTAQELLTHFKTVKGEIVLLIQGEQ
ncbi:MAG: 16S rRNA (cytidine(1402)-2'-O)-methyltransferase [Verrucomicrobia bacterium]|nr:16S rRNA (cytidine(1402)-2'-O)-methyltransferase [Verrucomicrobiota bacterium]